MGPQRIVLLLLMATSSVALCVPLKPSWFVDAEMRFRPVPSGIGMSAAIGQQTPLYKSTHPALEQNGFVYGAYAQFSPINFHPGVFVRLSPLSVLDFECGLQALSFFGLLNSLQTFSTTEAPSSQGALNQHRKTHGVKSGGGVSGYSLGRLKLKIKQWVLVSEYEMRRLSIRQPSDVAWFDVERNMLMEQTDFYRRSLTLTGWSLNGPSHRTQIISALFWAEGNQSIMKERTLAGLAFLEQSHHEEVQTRWLFILATYLSDRYQQNELFGAFVWKRSWRL